MTALPTTLELRRRLAECADILCPGEALNEIKVHWVPKPFDIPAAKRAEADMTWNWASERGLFNAPPELPGLVSCLNISCGRGTTRLSLRPTWMYAAASTNFRAALRRRMGDHGRGEAEPEEGYDRFTFDPSYANPLSVNLVIHDQSTSTVLMQRRPRPSILDGSRYQLSAGGYCTPEDRRDGVFDPWVSLVREAHEETGQDLSAGDFLPLLLYRTRWDRAPSIAALLSVDDQPHSLRPERSTSEVAGFLWVPFSKALSLSEQCPPAAKVALLAALQRVAVAPR